MQEEYYTPQEVAKILNIAYMTVYRWIQSGKLKAYQVEKQYRIDQKDLDKFIKKGEKTILPSVSESLSKFIGSGMMDYAYIESKKFPIDLTLSANPLGFSPLVRDFYQKKDISFFNYSEVVSIRLKRKLGKTYGFSKDEVLLGAGASDLLHLCFTTFMNPGEEVIIPLISFPAFEFLAILTHGTPKFIPFTESLDLDYYQIPKLITNKVKMIVLCNPNNPTGKKLNKNKIEKMIKDFPNIVFLIDEAGIDFGGTSFLDLIKKYSNLLIIQSFSKGFGLAGLRVGYIFGHKDLIYALQRRQTPFSVNIVAQKLAEVALDDLAFLKKTKNYVRKELKYFEEELHKLEFFFVKSDSNFILLNISSKFRTSKEFINMINEKGANVVNGDDFKGLNSKYVRISIRHHETNEKFISILKELISN